MRPQPENKIPDTADSISSESTQAEPKTRLQRILFIPAAIAILLVRVYQVGA